jgi:ATP-dependent DNA helicase DinG
MKAGLLAARGLERLEASEIEFLLGPQGPLARVLPGFEHRGSQVEMAVAVADAFRAGGQLLVEAGTGTGKTLAYLIPAVLSGQKVVISTGTKNLQEQLFYKDIPLLRRALGIRFKATVMKGRSNYLCRSRYDQFAPQPTFRFFEEAEHWETLVQWASLTKTGDRAEIPGFPDGLEFWNRLSAKSENCVGKECRDFERCWVTLLRQRAAESDLVIVNHHLLFADLLVREGSYGQVLPDYDYLVIDEAHQIEDVATQYFGVGVNSFQIEELVRDVEAAWEAREFPRARRQELAALRQAARNFFEAYRSGSERYRIGGEAEPASRRALYQVLLRELQRMAAGIKALPKPDEVSLALLRRSAALGADLSCIVEASDPDAVSWCEQRERSVALRSSPIDVSELARRHLLERKAAVVLTSATLAVDSSFTYLRQRLGLSPRTEKALASPFHYSRQAVLYVPRHLPDPRHPAFVEKVTEEVLALTAASRGRAFLLFTSFANLHGVRERLRGKLDFPLLVQGERSRSELLDLFRATPSAVLLATSSFWQGVDVAGEQLSLVVIDKLPFASPSDPLISARIEWMERRGGSAFNDYQVPMAILTLKQGLGRLIRTATDRGALAVLDSRLLRMGYGERFLKSLPPCPLTHRREDVERFFAREAAG